jgi:Prealbumin-like fold domain
VIQHVVGGGGATASDFTMHITGTKSFSFPGEESPGTDTTVDPGTYSVSETGAFTSDYKETLSGDCTNVTIADGETKTCTVTNTPTLITVIKHVVAGGSKTASDFSMSINGVTVTGVNPFPGSESGTTREVTPGNYNVTESNGSGYIASFSSGCTGTIALGESTTCTVTNTPETHLIVIKHVVNANGGKAAASQFSMKINGLASVSGANPFPGAESPGTNKLVSPGTYTVTETGPSGYILVPSADCSGTIDVGQTKTCTMLNHDIAPRNTIGYWKNHLSQVSALLPQKLGNYNVATTAQATAVFNATNCSSSTSQDAIGCLAGQLLAAELNLANFASPCIQPTVNKATTFLSGGTVTVKGKTAAGVNYIGPSGTYTLNATQRAIAVALSNALNAYNNNTKSCTNV